MISIIICSRKPKISNKLTQNINSTIGTKFQIIVVDNSLNNYSIFSAYNEGVKAAIGDVLCFMHEDVFYHTDNWGKEVENYFQTYKNVGMVGVAGSHFLPNMPSAWWDTEARSGHLLQGSVVDGHYRIIQEDLWSDYKANPTLVVSVDGLWMCFRRSVFDKIRWDDLTFNGFHGYDTDISLQVWNSGYEVHVFWDVLIEHMSVGVAGIDFYHSLDLLYEKWKDVLPMIKGTHMSEGELLARKRIAELRHELFYSNYKLREICQSRPYRFWQYLHSPSYAMKSLSNHLNHIKNKIFK